MSTKYSELFTTSVSRLDSLHESGSDKPDNKALEDLTNKEAYQDSLSNAVNQMTTEEKVGTIPIVQAGQAMAEFAQKKVAREVGMFNKFVYDTGAGMYNLAGVPLNTLGRLFGYNPGFSGGRFMQDWFGQYVGIEERGDRDTAWGTYAPEGGEFAWEKEEQE
jgi:hypothetical protein